MRRGVNNASRSVLFWGAAALLCVGGVGSEAAAAGNDGEIIPYALMVVGRSGSSWLSTRIAMHPCAVNYQEQPCSAMRAEIAGKKPTGAFFEEVDALFRRNPQQHTAKCDHIAVGSKCGVDRELVVSEDWATEGRAKRWDSLLKAQASPVRVVHLVRNNTLDFHCAAGGCKGSESHAVFLETNDLVRKIERKRSRDALYLAELQASCRRAGSPFLAVTYEGLCADHSTLEAVFAFLGLPDSAQNAAAAKLPDATVKKHRRNHRQMFSNYDAVAQVLVKAGFADLLIDTKCAR